MKKPLLELRVLIILTVILAFVATNAQAAVDVEFTDVSLDKYSYPPNGLVVIEYLMRNIGDERSGGGTAYAYASSDTVITEDDYYLGDDYVDPLEPDGPQLWQRVFGQFPDDIPPGEYYIGMISSSPGDVNPDNDIYCDSSVVSIDNAVRPDLIFGSIEIRNSSNLFYPGQRITIRVAVENVGVQESDNYYIACYASIDSTITEDDYLLCDRGAGSLGPGEGRSYELWGPFPDDIPVGEYYIGGIIHCPMETNLDNNSDYGDMANVRAYPPDLVVQSVDHMWDAATDIVLPGDSIDVELVVENTGIGRANSYVVDYYASGDSDYYLGSEDGGSLEPGEEHVFTTSCEFPPDIPIGDYYISVIITSSYDSGSRTTEGESGGAVWVGSPTDLAVQSVQIAPGAYLPGEDFVIYSLIENIGGRDSESYTVDYYASTDATITKGDHHIGYVKRSGLAAGEKDSYETTCPVPFSIAAGSYYIGIIITCRDEYDPTNNVGRDDGSVQLVHPPGYVCGQVQYRYRSMWGALHPIRYALVEIHADDNNNDPLDDRLIGQTHTDNNGDYGIVLTDQAGGHDIYVKVLSEAVAGAYPGTTGKICVVKDDVLDETYSVASPLYPHPRDSSVMVNMTAPGSGGEFMVYDSVIEGFHKTKTFFGIELDEVAAYWPCSEDTSYYDPCNLGIYISQDDRGDRDVIMHEYGHHIAQIYEVAQGPVGDNPVHFWNADLRYEPVGRTDEHAMNLAFREAWASLFSIATQYGDRGFYDSGDTRYQDVDEESGSILEVDLETRMDGDYSPGQYFENMNTCALWDIFDDSVDDNDKLSDTSLQKIWTISRDYKPDNIEGFWDSWFRNYDYEQEMKDIFETHEMPFVKPGQ